LALGSRVIKSEAERTLAAERSVSVNATSVLADVRIEFTLVDVCKQFTAASTL